MSAGMQHDPDPDRHASLLRRINRRRRQARLVLLFEILWPALWPPLGVAGLFLCLALLNVPQSLPPWPHALLLVGFGGAVLALLVRGIAQSRMPDGAAADRRLEREAGLAHRPLAALSDRPAFPGGEALWRAHVARAAAQVRRLRAGLPRPGLAARDRRALRGGLLVALIAAGAIAGGEAPDRMARAFSPGFPPRPAPPAPLLQAWITPPVYTGVAPLFLKPGTRQGIIVPAGSHLTVSLTGGSGRAPSLLLNGHPDTFRALDKSSFQADRDLASGGRLAVRRGGQELAAWDLTVVTDQAPRVSWAEPPGNGRRLAVRLPWQASDDYGLASVQAELRLRERPDAAPLVVSVPLPGGMPKHAHGLSLEDLTAHPWAGLAVVARLVAHDAPGQKGSSGEAVFTLPERAFHNPVARVVIAVRKQLSLHPQDRMAATLKLDALSAMPKLFGADLGAYLNLRAIVALLRDDRAPDAVPRAQRRMWELALHMEETAVQRTARALEQARQALREALDRQAKGEHVDPEQLDKLMQKLQQALREHLQALAEQMRQDRSQMANDANAERIDARQVEKLAQQMREAAREGRMDEARQAEAELERMLKALRNARQNRGNGQKAAERRRGRQSMNALQDMVQREGGLLDHSQARENADQPPEASLPGMPQLPGFAPRSRMGRQSERQDEQQSAQQQAGEQRQAKAQRQTDRRVQQALRRALGELMQQFGDMTGKLPPALGDADRAMQESAQALQKGNDPQAGAAQQRAIASLQKSGRQMRQQMAKMFGNQNGKDKGEQGQQGESAGLSDTGTMSNQGQGQPMPGEEGEGQTSARRDPFGRLLQQGTSGADESGDVTLPERMERVRTRAIEEELRRRSADRERPREELDYIERLLKQF